MTVKHTAPFPGDIGPRTHRYLSYRQLQERLFLSRTQTFRLEQAGARLMPDVEVVPGTKGWDPERVLAYGMETGRLDALGQPAGGWHNGRPRNRVQDGSLPEMKRLVQEKYSKRPKVYLGSALCSYLYGNNELAVLFSRKRDSFMPASVLVGDKLLGWDELEVIRFGRQTGRLDDPAVLKQWAVRRTQEFGMDPHTPWVVELLGEDNLPQLPEKEGDTP